MQICIRSPLQHAIEGAVMTQPDSQPRTLLETVLALLEERFPWLGRSDQEEVSGADTIRQLSDLRETLTEQLAQSRSPCVHEDIVWEPLEIDYHADGTADVSQTGKCDQCGSLCTITYTPADPEVVG
jgi:hypothetical protein